MQILQKDFYSHFGWLCHIGWQKDVYILSLANICAGFKAMHSIKETFISCVSVYSAITHLKGLYIQLVDSSKWPFKASVLNQSLRTLRSKSRLLAVERPQITRERMTVLFKKIQGRSVFCCFICLLYVLNSVLLKLAVHVSDLLYCLYFTLGVELFNVH